VLFPIPATIAALGAPLLGLSTAPAHSVSVYPAPGVRVASPRTQISFRGAPASALGAITVTGSRSGRHSGVLRAHSDGRGASFVTKRAFAPGERVVVRTRLRIRGARDGDFAIRIARPVAQSRVRPQEAPDVGRGATQRFASRPDLVPPAVAVTTDDPSHTPGYVFLAPKGGRGQDGPMIVDSAGHLVWFEPMARDQVATDLRVQSYEGRPVLTWWQGGMIVGDGRGVGVIYDSSYRRVATVRAGNGYSADLHDFTITPQGTALVVAYERVEQDLRSVGGPRDGVAVDGIVQEIDVKTGLVLFEWHSLGSVALSESYEPVSIRSHEDDYMHVNSVALDRDGNFVVSARNTWAAYKIDRATTKVLWRLGGKRSSFAMGPGTRTAWQHDVRPHDDGTLTIYDNGASPKVHSTSRAITVAIDERARTAKLVSALVHPRGLLSATQGSVQRIPGGDTFVGAGSQRWFSEYSPSGRLLLDGHIARGNDSYRAYLLPWSGRPATPPAIAATVAGGRVTARASWNGATGVARWQLLTGPSQKRMTPVAEAPAAGFETALSATTAQPLVAVRALDAQGRTLATSAAQKVGRG
jgi:Arylsulfotransferase (ASST)